MSLLFGALVLGGCSTTQPLHRGVDWGEANCPAVSLEDISPDGNLIIRRGKTLKCQVAKAVSKIPCQGVTDSDGTDAVLCQDNKYRQSAFLFDKNKVLIEHKQINILICQGEKCRESEFRFREK